MCNSPIFIFYFLCIISIFRMIDTRPGPMGMFTTHTTPLSYHSPLISLPKCMTLCRLVPVYHHTTKHLSLHQKSLQISVYANTQSPCFGNNWWSYGFFVYTGWEDCVWAPAELTETNGGSYRLPNKVPRKHQLSHNSLYAAGEVERHRCWISVRLTLLLSPGAFRWMFIALSFVLRKPRHMG